MPEGESVRCEVGDGRRPVVGVGVGGGLQPGVAGGGAFLPDAVAAAGGVVGEDGHEAGFRLCFIRWHGVGCQGMRGLRGCVYPAWLSRPIDVCPYPLQ
ncbi:MAG TPA: hypothetical protein ENK38_02880 [Gammaproteobacteria bacterium]|nr:hypothetical protein [Gammaproteobacteria bacterium]